MISLVNKTFFITGLGSGIGLATGKCLADHGAQVTGTVVNEEQRQAVSSFTQDCYQVDVTDTDALLEAMSLLQRPKIRRYHWLCRCHHLKNIC